jgi:hypothetical protein
MEDPAREGQDSFFVKCWLNSPGKKINGSSVRYFHAPEFLIYENHYSDLLPGGSRWVYYEQ